MGLIPQRNRIHFYADLLAVFYQSQIGGGIAFGGEFKDHLVNCEQVERVTCGLLMVLPHFFHWLPIYRMIRRCLRRPVCLGGWEGGCGGRQGGWVKMCIGSRMCVCMSVCVCGGGVRVSMGGGCGCVGECVGEGEYGWGGCVGVWVGVRVSMGGVGWGGGVRVSMGGLGCGGEGEYGWGGVGWGVGVGVRVSMGGVGCGCGGEGEYGWGVVGCGGQGEYGWAGVWVWR